MGVHREGGQVGKGAPDRLCGHCLPSSFYSKRQGPLSPALLRNHLPPPPCRDGVWGAQELLALAALPVVQRLRNRLSHLLSPSTASGDGLPTGGADVWVKAARSMSARGEREQGAGRWDGEG